MHSDELADQPWFKVRPAHICAETGLTPSKYLWGLCHLPLICPVRTTALCAGALCVATIAQACSQASLASLLARCGASSCACTRAYARMTGATLVAARSGSHGATAIAAADTALRAHARQSSAAQRSAAQRTLLVGLPVCGRSRILQSRRSLCWRRSSVWCRRASCWASTHTCEPARLDHCAASSKRMSLCPFCLMGSTTYTLAVCDRHCIASLRVRTFDLRSSAAQRSAAQRRRSICPIVACAYLRARVHPRTRARAYVRWRMCAYACASAYACARACACVRICAWLCVRACAQWD